MLPRRFPLALLAGVVALAGPAWAIEPPQQESEAGAAIVLPDLPPEPPLQLDPPLRPRDPVFVAVPVLPEPVRVMLEAAIARNDPDKLATVVEFATATQPRFAEQIQTMHRQYLANRARAAAAMARLTRQQIRKAGMLKLWRGEGEIGLLRATGNTDTLGFSAGLKLERTGIDWRHKLQLRADYQRDNERVTREQYFAAYSPRVQVHDNLYAFGLAQFERDRFQGYAARATISTGAGYRLADRDDFKLSLEAGPAFRQTRFIAAPDRGTVSALATATLEWQVAERIRLTQDDSAYLEGRNSTFTSATAVEAGVSKRLKARLSYNVEHETSPPDGSVRTDTLSRFTFVYGF